MIYTIGRTDIYESYIDNDKNAAKRIGGTVWKTFEEAIKYCYEVNNRISEQQVTAYYKVYGVEADWEKDTKDNLDGHHVLIKDCKLIKIATYLESFRYRFPNEEFLKADS